jgi:hypothetical protein
MINLLPEQWETSCATVIKHADYMHSFTSVQRSLGWLSSR